jgi:D-glycero-alpha-D-manno-heptose-7-phosphate kinase
VIVTRAPLRVPLGGGGTDIPSYYRASGGFFVSAAINKYIYITINPRFEDSMRVSYSRTEIVESVDEIEHPIVREVLRLLGVTRPLEIISMADLPSNTGLGSSGSFTVGLLQALHTFNRDHVGPQQLAEEAFHIEAEVLGEPVGKQDQYIAAFGHIAAFEIACDGSVGVTRLNLDEEVVDRLENDAMLFYTGKKRDAAVVLNDQKDSLINGRGNAATSLDEIKAIGYQVSDALVKGDLTRFGALLDMHWRAKRRSSELISDADLDRWYTLARSKGALGGKLMGAGGGGFYLFYCPNDYKSGLRKALVAEGLREMRFAIDEEGSKVLINL